jgi:hypothetical protein
MGTSNSPSITSSKGKGTTFDSPTHLNHDFNINYQVKSKLNKLRNLISIVKVIRYTVYQVYLIVYVTIVLLFTTY